MICEEQPKVSLKEAREQSLKFYFTGKPCFKGHISQRRTCNRWCVACDHELAMSEAKKIANRKWALDNPSKVAEISKRFRRNGGAIKWFANNPDKRSEYYQRWREKYPDQNRVFKHKRRTRLLATGNSFTSDQIRSLSITQNYKCVNCKTSIRKSFHIDHIMPVSLGGSNDISNIQLLCPCCNLRKRAKHPREWARENGRLL